MKIAVIIPVVQTQMAGELLNSIFQNTIVPDRIIIIDNTRGKFKIPIKGLPIEICVPPEFLGTNEAWRLGFTSLEDEDVVCIFNDDIVISPLFFENLLECIEDHPLLMPSTVKTLKLLTTNKFLFREQNRCQQTRKWSGYAICIHKSLFSKLPPIPETMKVFAGDRWIYSCSHVLGYPREVMLDNFVYHHRNTTVKQMQKTAVKQIQNGDHEIFWKEYYKWKRKYLSLSR